MIDDRKSLSLYMSRFPECIVAYTYKYIIYKRTWFSFGDVGHKAGAFCF